MADLSYILSLSGSSSSVATALLGLFLGTGCGLVAGLLPGVSGRAGLVLVTPIAIGLGPVAGAMFLVAFHSVVHTSGSIPAILLGAPTSAAEAATVIDGYAMTRKGEGGRAVGAALAASAVGGVIGALLLLLMAPGALGLARYIGGPEMAALATLGLLSISALSGGGLAGGLMVACIGMIVSSIGATSFSGEMRYTMGLPALADGINVATIVTGLFVIPELVVRTWPRVASAGRQLDRGAVLAGFWETLRYRWLLLRTSLLSAVIGMMPGLGAGVAVWIAYGHARQTEPSETPYGEGAIAGVIAPEAANNAKEGGGLAPTLFFGIPSSSGMGILLAAFVLIGVEIGPRLLNSDPQFIYLLGATNILSNLIAVPLCLIVLPLMVRLAAIRGEAVAPVAIAAGITATWLSEPIGMTSASIAIFAMIGLLLKAAGLPRAPLLLGFVLAPVIESGMTRTLMIHGASAIERPGVLLIAAIALFIIASTLVRRAQTKAEPTSPPSTALPAGLLFGVLVMLVALFGLRGVAMETKLLPHLVAVVGLAAALIAGWQLHAHPRADRVRPDPSNYTLLGLLGLGLLGITFIGGPIGSAAFVLAAMMLCGHVRLVHALPMAGIFFGIVSLLETLSL